MELSGGVFSDPNLEAFLTMMRALVLLVGITCGVAFVVWRKAWIPLVGLVVVVLIGWASSNYPSHRLYGLQYPGDRLRNLSWCSAVAAGHSPFGTGTFGQTALEPVWPAVAGSLAMGRPERVPEIFRLAPAAILVALALLLYFHFGNRRIYSQRDGDLDAGVRGLLIAAFAVLLATPPLDFLAPFRGYWAKMFLLKPNHALGLLMVPFLMTLLARNTWPRSVLAGIWLGLLGWVFVVHWVFVCSGLVIYLLLSAFLKRSGWARQIPKFVVVLTLGFLLTLPYIYLIVTHFPNAVTLVKGANPDFPTRSKWGDMLPTGYSLFFRVTFDQGMVFYLGILGVIDWLRRRGRCEILWASMVASAYVLWGANALLYHTARAREGDEFYFFLLFVLSIAAGNGAFRLASLVSVFLRQRRIQRAAISFALPALIVVATTTLAFPYWWHPLKMDAHYRTSQSRLPRILTSTRGWILEETNTDDLFISSSELGQWIPALTGRRLLYPYRQYREDIQSLITTTDFQPEWLGETQTTYVVFDDDLSETLEIERTMLEESPRFVRVHQVGDVAFYELQMTSRVE